MIAAREHGPGGAFRRRLRGADVHDAQCFFDVLRRVGGGGIAVSAAYAPRQPVAEQFR